MPSSQWRTLGDDELAEEDFEPKPKKKLMRLDGLASLRGFNHFCTNNALVNRERSSSGKFLPFKQCYIFRWSVWFFIFAGGDIAKGYQ